MGLFDIFSKKKETGSSANPAEKINYERKQYFYQFAFRILPKDLFREPDKLIGLFHKNANSAIHVLVDMFVTMGGAKLTREDINSCSAEIKSLNRESLECIIISSTGAGIETGKLGMVPAPYFAAIVYSKSDLKNVRYYVLAEGFSDPVNNTSLRELKALDEANINCGKGCAPNADSFLQLLQTESI